MKKKCAILLVISLVLIFVGCSDGPVDLAGDSVIGEKAYSRISGLLLADGYLDFIKSDYDKDGHLLKEHIFGANNRFLRHSYINYEYDSNGKLLRSVKYRSSFDKPYADYTMEYEMESYFLYTYDEHGRAVMGTKYTAKGKLTDITVVLEYYDSGTLKSRSYYEDYYLTQLMEYDSLGRCTYQKTVGRTYENVAVLEYEGESGNVNTIDRVIFDKHVLVSMEYDDGGNIILLNEDHDSLDKTVVRELEYYDGTDRVKSYKSTVTSEYYDDKGANKVVSTTSSQTRYVYTDSGQVKEYYSSDNADDISMTILFEYDSAERLSEVRLNRQYNGVEEESSVTTYEYDESGNSVRIEFISYLQDGSQASSTVTKNEFDENGNKIRSTIWRDNVLNNETSHAYDSKGNQIWTSHKLYYTDGQLSSSNYTERSFDLAGNCIKLVENGGEQTTEWRYDDRGNMLWTSSSYKNSNGYSVYYEATNNVIGYPKVLTETTTKSNGTKTVYEIKYDYKGERVDSTYKKYDANGNIIYSGKTPDEKG
jgi:hypothetical protein